MKTVHPQLRSIRKASPTIKEGEQSTKELERLETAKKVIAQHQVASKKLIERLQTMEFKGCMVKQSSSQPAYQGLKRAFSPALLYLQLLPCLDGRE